MESIELELRISGVSGRRYRVVVERSAYGTGADHIFELPEASPLLGGANPWRVLKRRQTTGDQTLLDALVLRGKELFALVFERGVHNAFLQSYELAQKSKIWFRLRLSFEGAQEAAEWPWEALVGPAGKPLALMPKVSIERRPRLLPGLVTHSQLREGKPRLLVAGASPQEMGQISEDDEVKSIRGALGKKVTVKPLTSATRSELSAALGDEAAFDWVHLLGHGDFEQGEGGIWLQGASGAVRLSSRELVTYLDGDVQFVFLNVCHGGRNDAEDPSAGLANALLQAGVRAVIAMQREVTDPGAVTLAEKFYREISQGKTLVEALAKARTKVKRDECDWAVPILYLAGDDFALLPPKNVAPLPPEERPEPSATPGPPQASSSSWQRWTALVAGLVMLVGTIRWASSDSSEPADPMVDHSAAATAPTNEPEPTQDVEVVPAKPQDPPPTMPRNKETTAPPSDPGPRTAEFPDLDAKSRQRCPSPPGLDFQFIYVPGGIFMQGAKGDKDTQPPHQVTLTEGYCLSRFELTRDLYSAVMGQQPPPQSEARLPMASLAPDEVQKFLGKLNERDPAKSYRLPTEAEWEFAARAGTNTTFYFGEGVKELSRYGNCRDSDATADDRFDGPAPVGSFKANPWGFYDLYGNVWELVADRWGYYHLEPQVDPRGPRHNGKQVRRGGAFDASVDYCSSAARKPMTETRQKSIGLRIARTPVR